MDLFRFSYHFFSISIVRNPLCGCMRLFFIHPHKKELFYRFRYRRSSFLCRLSCEIMNSVLQLKTKDRLVVVKRVLWWIGLVLLLPASGGWFSDFPVAVFQKYPYQVTFSSHIWVGRMVWSTVIGLVCWGFVGLINCLILINNTLPTVRSQSIIVRVFVALVTSLIVLSAVAALVFLLVDVSGIPQ